MTMLRLNPNNVGSLTWPASENLICTTSANNQEWSIDLEPGDYTGTYWQVWSRKNGTILKCNADDNMVTIPKGGLWVQGGSAAGGNVNRMGLTAGMPDKFPYNQSKRGTFIYSNAIAFADPYNGNNNNDAGWIRHIEETANSGTLEIATGDDGNEPIVVRQYNTSSAIVRTATLLDASGNTNFPGTIKQNGTAVSLSGHTHSYLPLSGGTLTGALNLSTSGLTYPHAGGYKTDQYGNFIHKSTDTAQYWNVQSGGGTSKFKLYYESGNVEISGTLKLYGRTSFVNVTSLPHYTGTDYFVVGINSFSNGGGVCYKSLADTKTWLGITSSDRRLKHGIESLGDEAVEFIRDLEPSVYWMNGKKQVGFVAQDVADVEPWGTDMACEAPEGRGLEDWEKMVDSTSIWTLDYIRIIPPLVATVQKCLERIDRLEKMLGA